MPIKKFTAKTGRIHTINEPEDWISKLGKKVKAYFAKEKQTKRQKEIKATRLSRQSKQQLTDLSKSDYQAVMKILKGKK